MPYNRQEANPTRRLMLQTGVAAAGGLVVGALAKAFLKSCEPLSQLPAETPTPNPERLLNPIAILPPHSPERSALELQYAGEIAASPTLEQINRGFFVAANPLVRASLLDARQTLRTQEKDVRLNVLPEDKKLWAQTYGMHPEALAIAIDAYPRAKEIIDRLNKKKKLGADVGTTEDPENLMINSGGMARLATYETAGVHFLGTSYAFSHIGEGLAMEEINPDTFPNDKKALATLCEIISQQTGITYNQDNMPGSLRGDPTVNLSGGAIAIQFMPSRALEIYNLVKNELGISLNIFDLEDSMIMAWVYLARREDFGERVRYGYRRGYPQAIKYAIAKWNPFDDQIEKVFNAAIDYWDYFIGAGKYKF